MEKEDSSNNQEKIILKEIEQSGKQLDKQLAGIQAHKTSIITSSDKAKDSLVTFNRRGQVLYSHQQIRNNYKNAYWFMKWSKLPYCKVTIQNKCNFWLFSSIILTYAWSVYKKLQMNNKPLDLPFKAYGKIYLTFAFFGCTFSVIESLLFEPYCDIKSIHYEQNFSRKQLGRKIKQEYKNL